MIVERTHFVAMAALLLGLAHTALAEDSATYTLRYRFEPGEVVRWKVEQQARVETIISGTKQTADTVSRSVKVWRVADVADSGAMTVEHAVESIDMYQKVTGREEVRYNSITDDEPPIEFAAAAKAVGKPLVLITIDARGTVAERKLLDPSQQKNDGQLLLPMPEGPVQIGDHWTEMHEVDVTQENGVHKKIKTRQKFTLEEVEAGIATIRVATEILSPIHDPKIEAQLVQITKHGRVKFDVERGRLIHQQLDLDERVHEFSGESSVMHYVTRFTEEILPSTAEAAVETQQTAGPVLPPSAESTTDRSSRRPQESGRKR